jgi:hypothetical protein
MVAIVIPRGRRHHNNNGRPPRQQQRRWPILCMFGGTSMIITTILMMIALQYEQQHRNDGPGAALHDPKPAVPLSHETMTRPKSTATTTQRVIIGTFNTLPVYSVPDDTDGDNDLQQSSSSFSCVQQRGRSDDPDAWKYTSCRYENLCWDVATKEYVLLAVDNVGTNDNDGETSTMGIPPRPPPPMISLGGINPRWDVGHGFDRNSTKLQWAPQIRRQRMMNRRDGNNNNNKKIIIGRLDDQILLLPFHSMAGHNVGHLLWDDLFSLYCLIRAHGLQQHYLQQRLLLIRQSLPTNHNNNEINGRNNNNETYLYANCDIRRNKRLACQENFVRFLPYFGGVDPATFSSTNQVKVTGQVDVVCARTALAGLAYWTDHGTADHGWDFVVDSDSHRTGGETTNVVANDEAGTTGAAAPENRHVSSSPHNLARGKLFYDFGQYLRSHHHRALPNVRQSNRHSTAEQSTKQYITFSIESSRDVSRRLDFAQQIDALKQVYGVVDHNHDPVRSFLFRDLSIDEQMSVAATTRIFVTVCGGGAMTVTFLPRDTSVIVFYDDTGGLDFSTLQSNGRPARLDWDLLTNASHLRVHWLPIHRMNEPAYLRLFQTLIVHEMALMDRIGR